jgi:hypothetical protein
MGISYAYFQKAFAKLEAEIDAWCDKAKIAA